MKPPIQPPICQDGPAFKRLNVEFHFHVIVSRRALVSWAMQETFRAPGPWTFLLQRGRAVNDTNWVDVAKVTNQPWAWDNNVSVAQMDFATFYRVILTDGSGRKYTSQPVNMQTNWDVYDWSRCKAILAKENLLLKKAGTPGWLLKRRIWGERCPECTDPNTGAIVKPNCLNCYGTGITGGYYPALHFPVVDNPSKRITRLTQNQGLVTAVPTTVRAQAWAQPDPNDIWVSDGTQTRWRIEGDITKQASWRGVDLVFDVRMTQLPISDISYLIPIEPDLVPLPGFNHKPSPCAPRPVAPLACPHPDIPCSNEPEETPP